MTEVWVVHYSHRHGDDITVHANEKLALDAVAGFARTWWHEVSPSTPPDDDDQIREEYFALADETCTIIPTEVNGWPT